LRALRENFLAEFPPLSNGLSLSKPRSIPVQRSQDDSEQLCIDEEPTLKFFALGLVARLLDASAATRQSIVSCYGVPHAQILLIQTTIQDIAAHSFAQVRARLAPARSAIRAAVQSADGGRHILLHISSRTEGAIPQSNLPIPCVKATLNFHCRQSFSTAAPETPLSGVHTTPWPCPFHQKGLSAG
jgi:hypothetical protein